MTTATADLSPEQQTVKKFAFDSRMVVGAELPPFDQEAVKNEPMLFNCSLTVARELGGPITTSFLNSIGDWGEGGVIDTRVHMLMPGWYPCIPGWHHDDVPRSRADGQPNYEAPEYTAFHAMALINGDICPTQFAVGQCEMPNVPLTDIVYRVWHDEVERQINAGSLRRINVPSNRVVFFDSSSFHQGQKALANGWRWFGRISVGTGRKPTNEVRKQVQIYLEFPMEGW